MDARDILRKYERELSDKAEKVSEENYSSEYNKFKEEISYESSFYEKCVGKVGKLFKVKLKKSEEEKIRKDINDAKLDIKENDASAFSLFSLFFSLLITLLVSGIMFIIEQNFPYLLFLLLVFTSLFIYYYTATLPSRLAQRWRLKASSQMVPCILYVVVYMRHTSNLELAIRFASEHLQNPLALDFKKIFWDVEVGKYSTIKESLEAYLEKWRVDSREFVEAFHLIESSLYEPSNERRVQVLDKALNIILKGVRDKMEDYTREIRAPLTNIYMLGIVLPTLAIALLPLASTLMGGAIKWAHMMILFNVLIPAFVFYMTSQIMSKRPGGYGESELLEQNPDYKYYIDKKPYYNALFISVPFILIALIPILFQFTPVPSWLGISSDFEIEGIGKMFDFKDNNAGPFGPLALLLSLSFPIGIALFFSISYGLKTKKLMETRNKTKELEKEFASSIFQLGNRLADGIPAEMAFGSVAESLRGTPTSEFFRMVDSNIRRLGMSVNNALLHPSRGALIFYPSELIRTSMKILIESVKKSLDIAARALMSISQYVRDISEVNDRLKDLLAEVVSDMKSNMSFLAPVLAGIVVGVGAMITTILNRLKIMLDAGTLSQGDSIGGLGEVSNLTTLFNVDNMIPPYFLQIIVGIYLIEIVYILTQTLVGVESGSDSLKEKSEISKNMKRSIITYTLTTLISIITLIALAQVAVSGLGT